MKNFLALLCILSIFSCKEETPDSQRIFTSDIDNFWIAYDKIQTTQDTLEQQKYLKELFFDKGTPGLDGMIRARTYTPEEYLNAIRDYPKYWASIRKNTYKAKGFAEDLEDGIAKLKKIYPDLKPANIYFTVGALRAGGTSIDGMLLIGSELALGDSTVDTSEFPESRSNLFPYFKNNPINSLVDLNTHEYIHSQQNAIGGYDLLSQSIFEGVAEFVPVIALQKPSVTPAIEYGKTHFEKVRARFEKEVFSPWINNWIWNSMDNEFGVRDMGYYIGYAIAELHYNEASDKHAAIKEMIELDYTDSLAIEKYAEESGYFSKPLSELKEAFHASRPSVTRILEFDLGSTSVSPSLNSFTIEFSRPMDARFRSTGYADLGEEHFPPLKEIIFSEDGKTVQFILEKLEKNKTYQFRMNPGYRDLEGIPLKPLVVEFKTGG